MSLKIEKWPAKNGLTKYELRVAYDDGNMIIQMRLQKPFEPIFATDALHVYILEAVADNIAPPNS